MRWHLLVLAGVLLSPAAAAQIPAAPAPATPESEVLRVVRAVFDGMRGVDSAMVRPLFHPQARLISVATRNGATVVQVETAEDFIRSVGRPRTEVWDERLSNEKIEIDGALASVWVDYEFYRGTTRNHCGVDHFLLVREQGTWRIIELADTRRACR